MLQKNTKKKKKRKKRKAVSSLYALGALHRATLSRPDPTPVCCPQVYASSRPLRVGYYETDNYTMPTPAMRRALLETKRSLEAAGHTVWLRGPAHLGITLLQGSPPGTHGCHPSLASLRPACFVFGMGTLTLWDP